MMLNPKLNIKQLKREYARNHRIRVEEFLKPELAAQIREQLAIVELPMHLTFYMGGGPRIISLPEYEQYDPGEKDSLKAELNQLASQGVGYCYESVMPQKVRNRQVTLSGQGHDLIRQLAASFNSEEVIEFAKKISSKSRIVKSDAQLTRFLPGHYITRHRDEVPSKRRELAYILSLTDGWHPDWGGLLQFYKPDGSVRDAWTPKSNTLSLFGIEHIHSVTYVTPYAKVPRYSMTGWFMA